MVLMGIRKIVHIDMDEDLASGPKIGGQHLPDNFIPLFEQVRPSRIEQDTELQVQCVCSEYISQQLI